MPRVCRNYFYSNELAEKSYIKIENFIVLSDFIHFLFIFSFMMRTTFLFTQVYLTERAAGYEFPP